LGDSWLEKNLTIPLWTKIFKVTGIFDENFHKKYRDFIHKKRYNNYIDMVLEDIKNNIRTMNKKQIQELMYKKFAKPEFKIEG